jgi:hypothetical protein
MRFPITFIELATPDVPGEPLLKDHSWMLLGASSHFDLRGYFFLAPHLKKDASLGRLTSGTSVRRCPVVAPRKPTRLL